MGSRLRIKISQKKLWIPVIMAGIILFLSIFLFISKSCLRDVACVYTNEEEDQIEFYAENFKSFDITLTVYISLENLVASPKLPFTETIVGKSGKVKLLNLSVKDLKKRWKYKYHYYWTVGNKYAVHDDSYVYRLPYEKGTSHKLIQGYNGRLSHLGNLKNSVDFEMDEGTPVYAARAGAVVGVKSSSKIGGPDKRYLDDGNHIYINHDDGTIGKYLHLRKNGNVVNEGDTVAKGQMIGYSGNTGFSTTPHLHFGVYKSIDGTRVESFPIKFMTKRGVITEPIEGETYIAD